MDRDLASRLSTVAVLICGQCFNLFVQYAKRRLGINREFYRLTLPWGAATLGLMTLCAWLVSRRTFSSWWLLLPGLMTSVLASIEWIRARQSLGVRTKSS